MPSFKAGDLFSLPLSDGRFLTGRVVLDLPRLWRRKAFDFSSPLGFFGKCVLVEIYKQLSPDPSPSMSEVLIPGVFIDTGPFEPKSAEQWMILGHSPVDPTRAEFPEALTQTDRGSVLVRGEVELPLPLSSDELSAIDCRPTIISTKRLARTCLYYLDLKHLIGPYADNMHLRHSDLRFNEHREHIYRLAGEDPRQSYHELSRRYGHDLSRFYT